MSWIVKDIELVRMEFVMIAREQGINIAEACRQYGISRKTGYKWLKRYEMEGMSGLADRSRRPKNNPFEVSGNVVLELIRLRHEHPYWGPKKLRALLTKEGVRRDELPSEATIMRILRRAGLTESKGRGRPRKWKSEGDMSEASKPNEVWTVDFKGWWRVRDGRRCEPLTVRDLYSRYILCLRPMEKRNTEEVQAVFERIFERYGLPDAIRSDNGAPFASITGLHGLTRLSAWWRTLGIRLNRTKPGHPQDNGAHERMHRDLAIEIEGTPSNTLEEETERLECWRFEYNTIRPHEALGMKTPGDIYRRSTRRMADIQSYEYPEGFEIRKVRRHGYIRIKKCDIFLSEALRGMTVGLETLNSYTRRVYFCDLLLGAVVDGKFVALPGVEPQTRGAR